MKEAADLIRTIKLVLAFEGTRYQGWQSQKKDKTVQEIIEKVISGIAKEKIHVVSSSRTDSGVHAKALVAHFKSHISIPDGQLKRALNYYLPPDILVTSVQTVSNHFHARFQAKSKIYEYLIWNHDTRPIFITPYIWWCAVPLDLLRMKKGARYLIGRHDFSSFQNDSDMSKDCVRVIKNISIHRKHDVISIKIEANGFLKHMVRIIVGTLVEIARGRIEPKKMHDILQAKDRKKAGPTAKALGLTLLKVDY